MVRPAEPLLSVLAPAATKPLHLLSLRGGDGVASVEKGKYPLGRVNTRPNRKTFTPN